MATILTGARAMRSTITGAGRRGWGWYRSRPRWQMIALPVAIVLIIVLLVTLFHKSAAEEAEPQTRTVSLQSVGELSGTGTGTSIVGTVRSVTEAELLAQSGGTVRALHTSLGARVPAGFVIADLDNASEAAAVLQAEGSYDAAVAARNITTLQSGSAQTSFSQAQIAARTAYRTAFGAIDSTLENDVDQFFGGPTPTGPKLLINAGPTQDLGRKRQALDERIDAWRDRLPSAEKGDPDALIAQAIRDTQAVSDFLVQLAQASNDRNARSTDAQRANGEAQTAALLRAQGTVAAQLAALSGARDAYDAKKTSASVAGTPTTESGTQLAAANASVKTALGSLRAAQANYEKTRVRATIAGTVNFLPIKTGQYVSAFEHVATVANNGALEIVAYVPESARTAVSVGMQVGVEGSHTGTVTAVSPALDPITKQIEVRVAVDPTPDLVNGQSVRITLPGAATGTPTVASTSPTGAPTLLPLAAVKLLADSRAVFTVGEDGRLVAHTVTIGDVVGDRIQVLTGVSADIRIVTDVRGLSEDQKVTVGDSAL